MQINCNQGPLALILNHGLMLSFLQNLETEKTCSPLLPQRNLITLAGFEDSIKNWAQLETMTMPLCYFDSEMVKLIGARSLQEFL